ncbi:hypothetical protein DFQ05_0542 [Winogradskyella wandonensis]|uniref:SpoIIAA-like protein n=1 Tax=Winogradskyella wandonensis TaxID=1442586 RepID=A0A4V2PU49_9FLAO|nr:hypothetical protein [Winogradskyella wandonensis]TCK69031.1 hypothetical protein DFQ05_0542 [Winogradskyella wandonensis]
MSITEYNNTPTLLDYQEVKIGELYFFEKYVVSEFNEGVHIDMKNFRESAILINSHFNNRPFGVISNRINNYSIDLSNSEQFNNCFPNLKAYAVVCDSLFGRGVFEVENRFFKYNRQIFKKLEDAMQWVEKSLETAI